MYRTLIQHSWKHVLKTALCLNVCIALIFTLFTSLELNLEIGSSLESVVFYSELAVVLLLLILMSILGAFFHEVGHLRSAWIVGSKVKPCINFGLVKAGDNPLVFSVGGYTIRVMPRFYKPNVNPDEVDLDSKNNEEVEFVLMSGVFGGMFFMLVDVLFKLTLWCISPPYLFVEQALWLLLLASVILLLTPLLNFIPCSSGGIGSDGWVIRELRKGRPLSELNKLD